MTTAPADDPPPTTVATPEPAAPATPTTTASSATAALPPSPMPPLVPTTAPSAPVYRVAITGGPCAGKTTALAEISDRLRNRGFRVYVVPEAATLFFSGGASVNNVTEHQRRIFQTQLLQIQITLENSFVNIAAASNTPCFILCDRGTCDGRAYMSDKLWREMLTNVGWDMVSIRDARYDLVVHLVTAADGAEQFYTLESNKTRSETPQKAVEVDRDLQAAWVGHPHLRIVDNRTGFMEKIDRVDACISELAGLRLMPRVVRKFLLARMAVYDERDAQLLSGKVKHEVDDFFVEQTFLRAKPDVQESIRRRGMNRCFTYAHKVKHGRQETKRNINSREYNNLLKSADPKRGTLRIRRRSFLYNGSYFVLDCVKNVEPSVQLLRCHCEVGDGRFQVPEWLDVDREVTGDSEYTMNALSLRAFPNSKTTDTFENGSLNGTLRQ